MGRGWNRVGWLCFIYVTSSATKLLSEIKTTNGRKTTA